MKYTERIKSLREDRDLTQSRVAGVLNVGQRTYSDYEMGKTRIPIESMMRLAEFFDVSMDYICGLTDQWTPYPRAVKKKR